jgi:hypothetical protein
MDAEIFKPVPSKVQVGFPPSVVTVISPCGTAPVLSGRKGMVMVQDSPTPRVAPQSFVIEKSPVFPLRTMLAIVSTAPPVFVNVFIKVTDAP